MTLLRTLAVGAAAGAAGTTALNAATYVDMAARGRPSSSTPEQTVERLAERVGVDVPGDEETRGNRLSGLGPLTGIATGAAVGVVGALLRSVGLRLPYPVAALALGAAAMAASDATMTAVGVTDPRQWPPSSWAADSVPHLAYGLVTAGTLRLADPR